MIRNLKVKDEKFKIIILLGIAIILAVAIFNQQKTKLSSTPDPSPTYSTKIKPLPSNLTDEEKFILNPPSADASRSALNKHAQIVSKLAKIGNTLEINNCQPTPLVLEIKQGSEFTVKNNDNVDHSLIFDEEHIYKIPANDSMVVKADFKYYTGDYGYVCEGVGLTGFLHVVP